MTLIPPVSQYSNNYVFGPLSLTQTTIQSYMTVVVASGDKDGLLWKVGL